MPSMKSEELLKRYTSDELDEAYVLEQLYVKNLGLIVKVAKESAAAFNCLRYKENKPSQYTRYTQELLLDLRSEGALAMFKKVRKKDYDETLGKFSTYIYPYLKGAMYRYLEKNIGNLSLPREVSEQIRKVQSLYFEDKSAAEISKELGIEYDKVIEMIHYNTHFFSLEDLVTEVDYTAESGESYEAVIDRSDGTDPPDRIFYQKICLELLPPIFNALSSKDRHILGYYFGVYGYSKKSLDEIALEEMLTVDGVLKAVQAALKHALEVYQTSQMKIWRDAFRDVRKAQRYIE